MNFNSGFDPSSPEYLATLLREDPVFEPGNLSNPDPKEFLKSITPDGAPLPPIATPNEVRLEARERRTRLFAAYHQLHNILERHEATVQRRWAKKGRSQKLAVLLAAWPDMPTTHRPDFAAFYKKDRVRDAKLRGSFMWPYINQEDLLKSKTLLLLLNSRGRNHPSVFAAADGEATHLGRVSTAVQPAFLNGHVFIMNGITRDEDYGRLMAWEEHKDAFTWLHTRKQFLPGEGLMILEAQERVMAFLVKCCHLILHDIAAEDLLRDDLYPVQPEPKLKEATDTSGLGSLAVMAEEAPYRVPADLDLGRIEGLLAARLAVAEDHAWALREDPGYYASYLAELREHRQEMLKDTSGNVHPTLKPARAHLLSLRVIDEAVLETYMHLELYTELCDQARKLRVLQRRYAAQIKPLEDLPEPYLAALLRFRHYLSQTAKGPMHQLKMAVPASPPMRPLFQRMVPESDDSTKMTVMTRPGVKEKEPVATRLLWLLSTIWEDDRDLFFCKMHNVVDELDRLLKSEPRARELVSSRIASIIGDLSILGECLRQIESYQPWANGFTNAWVDHRESTHSHFNARSEALGRIIPTLDEKNPAAHQLPRYGDPSGNKFDYPVARRRNEANVEKLRAAERNLDVFWIKADSVVRSCLSPEKFKGLAMQKLLAQPRYLQRTPPWVEPKTKPKGTPTMKDTVSLPLSTLHLSAEPQSARKEIRAAAAAAAGKTKAKTRGKSSEADGASTPAEASTETPDSTPDPQPRLAVDARALKVFRILFFDPEANTTPGEVAWLDFIHALQATGFSAEKLYGSVWHFQPTTLDVERSIQFHEPHPHGKLPFVTARRFGRRLNRAYGWHGEMFVLKEKAQAPKPTGAN